MIIQRQSTNPENLGKDVCCSGGGGRVHVSPWEGERAYILHWDWEHVWMIRKIKKVRKERM